MGAHGFSHSLPRQIFGIKRAHEQPSTCIHKPPLKKSPLPCQTHSTSTGQHKSMGERCQIRKEASIVRGMSVPGTVGSKNEPLPQPLQPTNHCSRVDAPAPPAGNRDAAAARCPWRAHASGALQASACQISSGRTPARATAARHRRQRRSVAIAPSRLVRRRRGRAPLSLNVCGRST